MLIVATYKCSYWRSAGADKRRISSVSGWFLTQLKMTGPAFLPNAAKRLLIMSDTNVEILLD